MPITATAVVTATPTPSVAAAAASTTPKSSSSSAGPIIGIVAAIAIPNLLASRRAANEASAISSLRTIGTAESTYASTLGFGAYGDLAALDAADLIDSSVSNATSASTAKSGYFYGIQNAGGSGFQSAAAFNSTNVGTRRFMSDEAGVLFAERTSTTALSYDSTKGSPIGN